MNRKGSNLKIWGALGAALLLGACTPPKTLRGEFAEITPQQATAGAGSAPVRWGGLILSMENRSEQTCFEVLGRRLNAAARPVDTDDSEGRFLACTTDYKDPEVFAPGRDITVVGSLTGVETRKVGEYEYRYPKVVANEVYLWAERPQTLYAYHDDPFPYPYAYYGPYAYHAYPVYYTYTPAPTMPGTGAETTRLRGMPLSGGGPERLSNVPVLGGLSH